VATLQRADTLQYLSLVIDVSAQLVTDVDTTTRDWVENSDEYEHDHSQHVDDIVTLVVRQRHTAAELC